MGLGNRPDFTPSHQHVLPMGITVNTCVNRKNPVSGMSCISMSVCAVRVAYSHVADQNSGMYCRQSNCEQIAMCHVLMIPGKRRSVALKVALEAGLPVFAVFDLW
jgi:hypothetical protein